MTDLLSKCSGVVARAARTSKVTQSIKPVLISASALAAKVCALRRSRALYRERLLEPSHAHKHREGEMDGLERKRLLKGREP